MSADALEDWLGSKEWVGRPLSGADPKTPADRQKEIADKIEAAQRLLEDAARLASPLGGWCDQWEDIGRSVDHVQALWWRIHQAPEPGEPTI